MKTKLVLAITIMMSVVLSSCTVTSHRAQSASMGKACSANWPKALQKEKGPIELKTVVSGSWLVPREGLVNLDHSESQKLENKSENELVDITFHVLRHPEFGTYLINTGLESAWSSKEQDPKVNWLIEYYMHNDHEIKVKTSISDWLNSHEDKIQGVLLTHMHLYTLLGLPEIPADTTIYVGPGEVDHDLGLSAIALRGNYNRLLEPFSDLQVWNYLSCGDEFEGVIDVFGDGSLFSLWLPGYTPGHSAYLARTKKGLVLVGGDTAHTTKSWELGVPPGTFAYDIEKAAESYYKLRSFAIRYSDILVYPEVN